MARSRYFKTEKIDNNHYSTFSLEQSNRFKEPDTFENVNYFEYIVKKGDRLDNLAAKYLNDDKYWWAIALLNNMILPFLSEGQKIKIPTDSSEILDRI